jgi:hypothetical protein
MKKVTRKNWLDGEVLHPIALRGKIGFEFTKNAKNKVIFVFVLEFFFNFETLAMHVNILDFRSEICSE